MLSRLLASYLSRYSVHYGWVMVAITFCTMLATASSMGMPGVLIDPLRTEFGWTSASISGAMALRLILFGLVGPFAAALMERYGIRITIALAMSLIITGLSAMMWMQRLWELWLFWGVFVGVGTGMTAVVLGAAVASRWFSKRRGFVLGLLTASAASGQLLCLPLAAWLVEHVGWRYAAVPAVCACAVAGILALLFGANSPSSLGLRPFGELPDDPAAVSVGPQEKSAFLLALRSLSWASGMPVFWILFFTFAVCGFTTNGLIQTHFVPMCQDNGVSIVSASGILAAMGIFDFIGTVASGWLSDKFDARTLLFCYYSVRGAALLLLPYSGFSTTGLAIFSVLYGLEWIATVPPTVRIATLEFGAQRAPLVFGWIFTAHQIGAAIAAIGAGAIRDSFATYTPAYLIGGILCMLAAFAALGARYRGRRTEAAFG